MTGPEPRVAVLSNALDGIPAPRRRAHRRDVFDPIAHFAAHGMAAEELDLRDYFGRSEALEKALMAVQVVWALGGNAFVLRRAMRESAFDATIGKLLERRDLVYAGWSAGAVVAAPDLRGIQLMDDPAAQGIGHPPGEPIWEGLGLIDFHIVPHFDSPHAEAAAARTAADFYARQAMRFEALQDGDVVVKNGEDLRVLRSHPRRQAER